MSEVKERPTLFIAPMVRAILAGTKTQTRRLAAEKLRIRPRRVIMGDVFPGEQRIAETPAVGPTQTYAATLNPHGAVCAVLPDGTKLGMKPGEFDFVCPYADGRTYLDEGNWRVDTAADQRLWVKETWQALHVSVDPETGHADDVESAPKIPKDNAGRWWSVAYAATDPAADEHKDDRGFTWRPSIFMPRWASRITLEVTGVRVERVQDIGETDILAEGVTVDRVAEWTGTPWSDMPTLHHAWRVLWDSINADRAPWASNPWVWAITFRRVQP